ncbi:MAG: hypothetical protein SOZ00_07840 [Tidjanibacter sp.]|nr:hypothetical protein [Tidjanibacter sp.]
MEIKKDLKQNNYIGQVVYNEDPNFVGRCKIKVIGLFDDLDVDLIPWATPINSNIFSKNGSGTIDVPKIGTWCRVQFVNEDLYSPEYFAIQNMDASMIEEIKGDYQGAHVLLYDKEQELMIIFLVNSGLRIYYRESFIQISPDNLITIQHANAKSIIQLNGDDITIKSNSSININGSSEVNIKSSTVNIDGSGVNVGNNPTHPAVLGDKLVDILKAMDATIASKMSQTPPTFSAVFDSILSNTVKVG